MQQQHVLKHVILGWISGHLTLLLPANAAVHRFSRFRTKTESVITLMNSFNDLSLAQHAACTQCCCAVCPATAASVSVCAGAYADSPSWFSFGRRLRQGAVAGEAKAKIAAADKADQTAGGMCVQPAWRVCMSVDCLNVQHKDGW